MRVKIRSEFAPTISPSPVLHHYRFTSEKSVMQTIVFSSPSARFFADFPPKFTPPLITRDVIYERPLLASLSLRRIAFTLSLSLSLCLSLCHSIYLSFSLSLSLARALPFVTLMHALSSRGILLNLLSCHQCSQYQRPGVCACGGSKVT